MDKVAVLKDKLVSSPDRVAIQIRDVVHFAWWKPKEEFGWKHTKTFSPIMANKIYRSFEDLVHSLNDMHEGWSIIEDYQEEVDDVVE